MKFEIHKTGFKLVINALVSFSILFLIFRSTAMSETEKPLSSRGEVAASVNGVNITEDEVQRAIDDEIARGMFHKGVTLERREKFRKNVLDALIERELIYQEAKRLNLSVKKAEVKEIFDKNKSSFKNKKDFYDALERLGLDEDSYKALIEKNLLIQKVLKQEVEDKAVLPEGFAEKYYNENKDKYLSPEKIRFREIFIKVPAVATSEERKEKKKLAENVLKRLMSGEDFEKLAKEFSEDNYRESGGDVGFIHLSMLDEDIGRAVEKLRPGEISDIIGHIYGFYIFKVEERQPARQLSYEEVKNRLMLELPLLKKKEVRESFINGLKAKAKIEVY